MQGPVSTNQFIEHLQRVARNAVAALPAASSQQKDCVPSSAWQMLPFGSSGDGGSHFWNPNEAAEENRDWVPTLTTAPVFNSPFYATDQPGFQQPQVDVSALTELTGRSAAPSADNSWLFANLSPNEWQLPAQTGHNALASPVATDPSANWSGQSNAGELLGSMCLHRIPVE